MAVNVSLRARAFDPGRVAPGHVINVSSLLGRVPFATFRSAYCGAKHFLNALTATFRAEVQETHRSGRLAAGHGPRRPPTGRTGSGLPGKA